MFSGLWVAGEAAGGIHGKNRLGGNALTECVVFGRIVGTNIPLLHDVDIDSDNNDGISDASTKYLDDDVKNNSDDDDEEQNSTTDDSNDASSELPWMTMEEVMIHNGESVNGKDGTTDGTLWTVINSVVYDLTEFEHPGGLESILEVAGKDGTEIFMDVHTVGMLEDLDAVGRLKV